MEKLRNKLCVWLLLAAVKLSKADHKAGIKTDGCFRTFTRKKFNVLNPTSDMIDIKDIAKGLAYKPHFSGFSQKFFSIAEHSLLVEEYTRCYHGENNYKLRLEALLHDASEAYTGDMIKPIKNLLPNFVVIEKRIQKAIYKKYDITPYKNGFEVKFFDNKAQDVEASVFFDTVEVSRKKQIEEHYVKFLSPDDAYAAFMGKFNYLTSKISN